MKLSELTGRRDTLRAEATDLSKRLQSADASEDDVKRVDELADELADVETQITEARKAADDSAANARSARDRIAQLVNSGGGNVTRTQVDESTRQAGNDSAPEQRPLTPGERFANSPQLEALRDRNFIGSAAVDMNDMSVSDFVHGRATIDNTTQPAPKVFVNTIDPTPDRPLRLADLIDRQTTGLNAVPYLIEGANTGVAAEVAEGSAKPEATFTFTEDSAPVRTIAHWVPITRQAAEDNATMVGYVEGRLAYGLELRLDTQILGGNGTAPNLRGIINTSGVGTYTPGAAEARIITIRKAITIAQLAEYQPDAVVLHPNDWQSIELDQDTTNNFRVNANVQNALTPRIWGLNVVVTTGITTATYLVGAFKMGATLWERHGVRILMSDSHASNFTSNILVILAEMRAALTVWRPAAFVKGGFV